ncbi:MAG TPA: CAP domain-containing protein [Candidatus Limnocylindria bacterium]|nr:CAP domain-containing protein [Candidatus Limnocylindria bacterium]
MGGTSLLAAALLAWTPSTTTAWNQSSAEATLWQLLNGDRVNNGLRPLQQSGTMVSLARWRSKDQVQRDYFSHTILGTGYEVYHWYDLNGVNYKLGGENIGWNNGYSDAESAVAINTGFMNSPGHRANILNKVWTHGGVGAYGADNVSFLGKVRSPRFYTELFYQSASSTSTSPTPPPPAPTPKPKPAAPPPASAATAPRAAASTVAEPQAQTVSWAVPVRPNPTARLDGAELLITGVAHSWTPQFVRSMTAPDGWADPPTELASAHDAPASPYRVEAASATQAGFLESVLGSLLSLFLG